MQIHRTPRRFVKSLLLAAAATGALSSAALAGPDVIVGELDQVQNYGAVGAMRAYSVGTISCNIGDQPLEWEDQPQAGFVGNVYPVISGNAYRLLNGRFQQVGQQWLKHGFCALNGNVCSSCPVQSNPGCRYLMPGCSDPYSASLNGSQGGLGPKWEVNPATGFFPVNWTSIGSNGSSTGDAIYKRIQVADADLSTTTGIYFVSSLYVHPQDSANDVDNNSQSYRRVTVSGTNKDMTVAGSTQRQKPAIFAWKDFGGGIGTGNGVTDNGVTLAAIDVPTDGRFWVGSKVIDLGNGSYRYEYAVQNLTSHRAGRSFTVPIQAGATVSAVGFSDVNYHSGEKQRGDDWTFSTATNSVSWTMPDLYADDQQENALRWDTIYNFWFISTAVPTTGNVALGMFLPGTGGDTFNALVATPGAPGVPLPPVNDNCANAIVLGLGSSAFFDNTLATTDGLAETLCNNASSNQVNNDVWYTFTTDDCAGDVVVSVCGASFDTKVAIYNAACPTAIDSAIACNDDATTCTNNLNSIVTFAGAANTTYRVRVGGFNQLRGTGTLTITRPVCLPTPPANDACSNAAWLADGVAATGGTQLATFNSADGTATCGGAGSSADVWYKYRPTVSGPVVMSTCGSSYDTVLSLHAACGSPAISGQCNDDHGAGAAFCGQNLASRLAPTLVAGTTYYIRVAGYNGGRGDYSVTVTGGGGVVPPVNDDCSGRAGLGLGNQAFSLVGATTDGPVHSATQTNNDIWYNHPGLCTGNLSIKVCGATGFTPRVAVYTGVGCSDLATRFVGFATPTGTCAGGVEYVMNGLTAGTPVTVRVGSTVAGQVGAATLTLTCLPAGPTCNDIDFNNDGLFPDDSDLVEFLNVLAGGACSTASCDSIDFNNDGLFPDDNDLVVFLRVLSGGDCE